MSALRQSRSRSKDAFSGYKTIDIGMKHGTVAVLTSGGSVEITTYRIDGEYLDNRHPQKVVFTDDLTEDLARRDFTMNAIAYHPKDGLRDPFLMDKRPLRTG